MKTNINYFWLGLLPDGWSMTFCAKGKTDGEQGYLDSAYLVAMEELQIGDEKILRFVHEDFCCATD